MTQRDLYIVCSLTGLILLFIGVLQKRKPNGSYLFWLSYMYFHRWYDNENDLWMKRLWTTLMLFAVVRSFFSFSFERSFLTFCKESKREREKERERAGEREKALLTHRSVSWLETIFRWRQKISTSAKNKLFQSTFVTPSSKEASLSILPGNSGSNQLLTGFPWKILHI